MSKAFPRQVAAGVCALMAAFAAPVFAQVAEPAPAHDLKRWLFAEGSTNLGFGFEQEILIANPTANVADVTLRFLPQDGSALIEGALQVQPYSRQGVNARQFAPNAAGVALDVTSTTDIVVERSMYWGGGLFNFGPGYNAGAITDMRAGHNVLGVNAPLTQWSFAEGAAGGPVNFQTYVLVSNPSLTESANVRVSYLTSGGFALLDVGSGPLGPGQRRTYFANATTDALQQPQVDFAIEVVSDNGVPVVAERAMYWGPNLRGGHAAMGVQPNSVWYFAEGIQGAPPINFDTYVLLFNPSTETINVEIDFFGPGGLAKSVTKTLLPRSRDNVYAGEFPAELAGGDKAFSVRALNVDGKPFVAERAVYWKGLREGTASAGTIAPARKWGFADGQEGGFAQFQNPQDPDPRHFATYYQVLNNTTLPVTVRGVFYVEDGVGGSGAELTIVVPALSRETFAPSNIPALHNKKFAAFFEASDAVIVERAMYWGTGIVGGHASAGAVLPDSLPMLPTPAAPAGPTLTSITPTRGAPSGGTQVTITGTGIGLAASSVPTTVSFGVTPVPPASVKVLNANTIQLVTPPSGRGFASVIVNTRGTTVELPGAFEFFDPFTATGAAFGSLPNRYAEVQAVAARNPFLLAISCGNYNFMYDVVAELRRRDNTNRWGLNWKRGLVGDFSHDIVNYYYGPEGGNMRNSTQVWVVDIIGGHCGSNPNPFWLDQTGPTRQAGTVGRWTTDPMCNRYRDVMHNGQYLFPECR